MKDGHYSRPVWADDGWLAKYAGKTLDEDNVGADGGVSAEYVPGATATIGKYILAKVWSLSSGDKDSIASAMTCKVRCLNSSAISTVLLSLAALFNL